MRYAGLIKNDIAAAPGVCVSFFAQGCPFHCKGCHNPETWDYNGGKEFSANTIEEVLQALDANGIHRNLCIMGGEPLDIHTIATTYNLLKAVKEVRPTTKVYLWTGYTYDFLQHDKDHNTYLNYILSNIDCIIDGQYIEELRDITLKMRGSSNQQVICLKDGEPIWQI